MIVEPARQPVRPVQPQHRSLERQVGHGGHELDHVHRRARSSSFLPDDTTPCTARPAGRAATPACCSRRPGRRSAPTSGSPGRAWCWACRPRPSCPSITTASPGGSVNRMASLSGPACTSVPRLSALSIIGIVDDLDEIGREARRASGRRATTGRRCAAASCAERGARAAASRPSSSSSRRDHARAPAGSATRRPIASAMSRTSFIIRSNCSG